MSENRSNYSSAPLQDVRRRPPKPPAAKPTANRNPVPGVVASNVLLQVMLVAVLPLAFIAAMLLIKANWFYWAFIITSVLCLGAMYLLKAFVPSARQVLGVIHAAMIAVVLFTIAIPLVMHKDVKTPTTQELQSMFNENTSASIVEMSETHTNSQQEATPNPGSASLAQQKLEQFMAAWGSKDYATMVSYASPNWVNQHETQRDAETAIFHLSAIRTPVAYTILDVSGSDSDQTRTISMQASISKSDGKEPQTYNFQVLMIRSNNEWYVDPNSISSSQVVQPAAQQPADTQADQQTTQVTDTAQAATTPQINPTRSDTVLYYNQDGGEYYHLDPNCTSINKKYLPLKATFYYRDVSSDTFKNLKTCPYCNAPARP